MALVASLESSGSMAPAAVSFSGSGFHFGWQLGVLAWLQQHHDLSRVTFLGASGGAFVAYAGAAGVAVDEILEEWLPDIYAALYPLPGRLAFLGFVEALRATLLKRHDAALVRRLSGRLVVSVTRVRLGCGRGRLSNERIDRFEDLRDLASALVASATLPFVATASFVERRDRKLYVDGGLTDNVPAHDQTATVYVPCRAVNLGQPPTAWVWYWDFAHPVTLAEMRARASRGYRDAAACESHFEALRPFRRPSPGPTPRLAEPLRRPDPHKVSSSPGHDT